MAGERRSLIHFDYRNPAGFWLAGFFADDGVVVALRLKGRLDVYDLGFGRGRIEDTLYRALA